MTEETANIEPEVIDVPVEQVEAHEESQAGQSWDAETEEKARSYGWVDEENYNGRNEWTDPKTFVENTERSVPRLQTALQRQSRQIDSVNKQMKELLSYNKRNIEEAKKDAYEKAMHDIEELQERAVEEGDTDAFRQAKEQERELAKKAPVESPQMPQPNAAYGAFKKRNPWLVDKTKVAFADDIAAALQASDPHLDGQELYTAVEKEMANTFLDIAAYHARLDGKKATAPSMAGGSKPQTNSRTGKSKESFDSLPQDCKALYYNHVQPETKQSKEDYAKSYYSQF